MTVGCRNGRPDRRLMARGGTGLVALLALSTGVGCGQVLRSSGASYASSGPGAAAGRPGFWDGPGREAAPRPASGSSAGGLIAGGARGAGPVSLDDGMTAGPPPSETLATFDGSTYARTTWNGWKVPAGRAPGQADGPVIVSAPPPSPLPVEVAADPLTVACQQSKIAPPRRLNPAGPVADPVDGLIAACRTTKIAPPMRRPSPAPAAAVAASGRDAKPVPAAPEAAPAVVAAAPEAAPAVVAAPEPAPLVEVAPEPAPAVVAAAAPEAAPAMVSAAPAAPEAAEAAAPAPVAAAEAPALVAEPGQGDGGGVATVRAEEAPSLLPGSTEPAGAPAEPPVLVERPAERRVTPVSRSVRPVPEPAPVKAPTLEEACRTTNIEPPRRAAAPSLEEACRTTNIEPPRRAAAPTLEEACRTTNIEPPRRPGPAEGVEAPQAAPADPADVERPVALPLDPAEANHEPAALTDPASLPPMIAPPAPDPLAEAVRSSKAPAAPVAR